jgi:general secretion pathway protein D
LFSEKNKNFQENEVLIVLTPRIVRLPELTPGNLRALYTGTESNVQLKAVASLEPASPALQSPVGVQQAGPNKTTGEGPASGKASELTRTNKDSTSKARLHFVPTIVNLKTGDTITVRLLADNVNDLFSLPVLLEYDPKVISVQEVRHGNFFSDGGQEIAVVQQIDEEQGHAIVSATRPPRTAGVSGSGTVLEFVLRGVASGTSALSLPAVKARNSKQTPIDFLTDGATVRVSP